MHKPPDEMFFSCIRLVAILILGVCRQKEIGKHKRGKTMEFLFELIFEIIVEGSLELGTYRKVPMAIRVIAMLLFLAVYGGISVVIFVCGYIALQEKNILGGILFIVAGFGIVLGGIYEILKKLKENNAGE